tara:strand:+ start:2013 stop:3017 length:1005 start_codon:yes stop_codon:yes gene_type:complete
MIKILYCGPDGGTCRSRKNGFIAMGYDVIDFTLQQNILTNLKWFQFLEQKSLNSLNLKILNDRLLKTTKKNNPNIVWIDKGTYVYPETLSKIKDFNKNIKIVHHCTDDVEAGIHKFNNYLKSLDLYDAHFTCNEFNIDYLKKISTSNFFYNALGYDHTIFYPNDGTKKYDLCFIGHHEPQYEKYISVATKKEINFMLGGAGWNSSKISKSKIAFSHHDEEICPKIVSESLAGLGLYSSWNRNVYSGRVLEIPAQKTALIVKRNSFIESLYDEDSEAIFFDNSDELSSKLDEIFKDKSILKDIAHNGYKRCLANKCSWEDGMRAAINDLQSSNLI